MWQLQPFTGKSGAFSKSSAENEVKEILRLKEKQDRNI